MYIGKYKGHCNCAIIIETSILAVRLCPERESSVQCSTMQEDISVRNFEPLDLLLQYYDSNQNIAITEAHVNDKKAVVCYASETWHCFLGRRELEQVAFVFRPVCFLGILFSLIYNI